MAANRDYWYLMLLWDVSIDGNEKKIICHVPTSVNKRLEYFGVDYYFIKQLVAGKMKHRLARQRTTVQFYESLSTGFLTAYKTLTLCILVESNLRQSAKENRSSFLLSSIQNLFEHTDTSTRITLSEVQHQTLRVNLYVFSLKK